MPAASCGRPDTNNLILDSCWSQIFKTRGGYISQNRNHLTLIVKHTENCLAIIIVSLEKGANHYHLPTFTCKICTSYRMLTRISSSNNICCHHMWFLFRKLELTVQLSSPIFFFFISKEKMRGILYWKSWSHLSHWGLMIQYADMDLGQQWIK